jgi:hypothetical protein
MPTAAILLFPCSFAHLTIEPARASINMRLSSILPASFCRSTRGYADTSLFCLCCRLIRMPVFVVQVGQLMGAALRTGQCIPLSLAPIVWKQLCGEQVTPCV